MKTLAYSLIFIFFNFNTVSFAQTHWTKYTENPVFATGPSGNWDDAHISWPFVIYDGTQFIMYYTGFPIVLPEGGQVGRATSPDGINWTREEGNPVLTVGLDSRWDDATVFSGPVIFDGSEYKMWYVGYDGIHYRIGLVTSLDGIGWIKYEGNPVFDLGDPGQWDDSNVAIGSVILDESVYKMWYQGYDGSIVRTGYATSPDGVDWTKYAENPILVTGSGWETQTAGIVSVLLHDSEYKAWYMGQTPSSGRIGYATAPVTINVPDEVETIQAAIDSAVDGNLVLVDEGTYYENINFKGKAITVASCFYVDGDTSHKTNTIIDGSQHENPDSGSVVYFVSGEDTNTVLCGFTITGGSGTKGYWGG